MKKEQLEALKGMIGILESCYLKDKTTIPEGVRLITAMQVYAKTVKDLEDEMNGVLKEAKKTSLVESGE